MKQPIHSESLHQAFLTLAADIGLDIATLKAAEFHRPRVRPRNKFLPRLATNLKPGFSGQFGLETIVVALEVAACLRPGRVIYCLLDYQGDGE